MQRPATFCDRCGAEKKSANHWWRSVRVPGPRLTIMPHELPVRDERAKVQDLCGERCVMAAVAEFMNEPKEADTE